MLRRAAILALLLGCGAAFYVFRIKNGFPVRYETDQPCIDFTGKPAVLLFSKTTGYRHSESIEAAKNAFRQWGVTHGWFVYETEAGGVFNSKQLKNFAAIILNNCTGRLLNDAQKRAVEQYVRNGGTLIGIHAAGDFSHGDWPWLETHLTSADFSHHPLFPQLQPARVHLDTAASPTLIRGLPRSWPATDEWYIYRTQPKGMQVIACIDGGTIRPNGNPLFFGSKNFGMGKRHPVAWYRQVGRGRTFYTSMGHTAATWQHPAFLHLIENAVLSSM